MKIILNKYILYFTLIFSLFLTSCEKVIDLNLDQTEPKVVIEAILTDLYVKHLVSLSYSKNFDDDNKKNPISGAIVLIKEENGSSLTFTEQGNTGNYYSAKFKATPGKRYTLSIKVNGITYTAVSKMPLTVPIKSLNQLNLNFFGEERKLVQVNYSDPSDISNYYYYRMYINNFKSGDIDIQSDRFNDGKEVKNTLSIGGPDLKTGDKVKVQMLTVDENVYKYLFSLMQINGNGGPPTTPANPTSNFDNGALGFFSASTLSTDSLIVK